jgi:hypothetical protein
VATYFRPPENVWSQWIQTSSSTTTAGSLTVNHTNDWATAATSTATFTYANQVWDNWVATYTTSPTLIWQDRTWDAWDDDEAFVAARRRQYDELQARREQNSREALAAAQQQAENRVVAHARALELLDAVVFEEDRIPGLDLLLQIRGSDGELYRLEMHRETVHGNIVRVDEHGCILGRACVAPRMYSDTGVLPTADGWVGQYLGLKFDTAEFLSHANWSGVRTCQVPQVPAVAQEAA